MSSANEKGGYIKLHRKFFDSLIWPNINDSRLAVTILKMANWKEGRFRSKNASIVDVKRGELITSIPGLVRESGLTYQSVRTSLVHLEKLEFLTDTSTGEYRHIKVINYCKYQDVPKAPNRQTNRHLTGNQQATNSDIRKRRRESSKETDSQSFKTFWETYPKRVGKAKALSYWQRLKPSTGLVGAILKAVAAYKKSEAWKEPRYIPYPATWLSGRRWEDEIESKSKPPPHIITRKK